MCLAFLRCLVFVRLRAFLRPFLNQYLRRCAQRFLLAMGYLLDISMKATIAIMMMVELSVAFVGGFLSTPDAAPLTAPDAAFLTMSSTPSKIPSPIPSGVGSRLIASL